MKSIAPYAFGMKPTRDRAVVGHLSMGSMKCGLEAGDLRERWEVRQDQTYWSQIVRQMKRRQFRQSIQASQDLLINQDRAVMLRTAVNDAMPDSNGADMKLIPQPSDCNVQCGRNIQHRFDRIGAIGKRITAGTARLQSRATPDAVDPPLNLLS